MSRGVPQSQFRAHLTQFPFLRGRGVSGVEGGPISSMHALFSSRAGSKRKRKIATSHVKFKASSASDFVKSSEFQVEEPEQAEEREDSVSDPMLEELEHPFEDIAELDQEEGDVELDEEAEDALIYQYAEPSLRLVDTSSLVDATHLQVTIVDGKVVLQPSHEDPAITRKYRGSGMLTLRRRLRVLVDSFLGTMNHVKDPVELHGTDLVVYRSCSFLLVLGLSTDEIRQLCVTCPHVLLLSLEDTLLPKVNILRDAGLSTEHILLLLRIRPKSFLMPSDSFVALIQALQDLGITPKDLFRIIKTSGFFTLNGKQFFSLVKSFSTSLDVTTSSLLRVIIGKPSFLTAASSNQVNFLRHFHTTVRDEPLFYLFNCLKQSPWITNLPIDRTIEEQHLLYKQYWPHLDFYSHFFFKHASVVIHSQYQIETRIKTLMYSGMPQYMALECIERNPRILQYQLHVLVGKLTFFSKEFGLNKPDWERFVARYDSENVYRYHFLDKQKIIQHTQDQLKQGQTIQTHGIRDSCTVDFNGYELGRGEKPETGNVGALRLRIGMRDKRLLALQQKMNDLAVHYRDTPPGQSAPVLRQCIAATAIKGQRMVIDGVSPVYSHLVQDQNQLPLLSLPDLPPVEVPVGVDLITFVLSHCEKDMAALGLTKNDIYIQPATPRKYQPKKGKTHERARAPVAVTRTFGRRAFLRPLSYSLEGRILFTPAIFGQATPSSQLVLSSGVSAATQQVRNIRKMVNSFFPSKIQTATQARSKSLKNVLKSYKNVPLGYLSAIVREIQAEKAGIREKIQLFPPSKRIHMGKRLYPPHTSTIMGSSAAAMLADPDSLSDLLSQELLFYVKAPIIDIADGLEYIRDPMIETLDEPLMQLIQNELPEKSENPLDLIAREMFVESDIVKQALHWKLHSVSAPHLHTEDPVSTQVSIEEAHALSTAQKQGTSKAYFMKETGWSSTTNINVASLATLLHLCPGTVSRNVLHLKKLMLTLQAYFALLGKQDERLYAHGLLGENTYLSMTVNENQEQEVTDGTSPTRISHQNKVLLQDLHRVVYDTFVETQRGEGIPDLAAVRASLDAPRNAQLLEFERNCLNLKKASANDDSVLDSHLTHQAAGHPVHGPLLAGEYAMSPASRKRKQHATFRNKYERQAQQYAEYFSDSGIGKDSLAVPKYSWTKSLFTSPLNECILVRFQTQMTDDLPERIEFLKKSQGYHSIRVLNVEGNIAELSGIIPSCLLAEAMISANDVITPLTVRRQEWKPLLKLREEIYKAEQSEVIKPKASKKSVELDAIDEDLEMDEMYEDDDYDLYNDEDAQEATRNSINEDLEHLDNVEDLYMTKYNDENEVDWVPSTRIRAEYKDKYRLSSQLSSSSSNSTQANAEHQAKVTPHESFQLPLAAAFYRTTTANCMPIKGNLSTFNSLLTQHVNAPQSEQLNMTVINYVQANPFILTRRYEVILKTLTLSLTEATENTNRAIEAALAIRASRAAYATHKIGKGVVEYAEKMAEENKARVQAEKKKNSPQIIKPSHTAPEVSNALALVFGRTSAAIGRIGDKTTVKAMISDQGITLAASAIQNSELPETVPLPRSFTTITDNTVINPIASIHPQQQFQTFLLQAPEGLNTHMAAQYSGIQAHRTVVTQDAKTQLLQLNTAPVTVPLSYSVDNSPEQQPHGICLDLETDPSFLAYPVKSYRYFATSAPTHVYAELAQLNTKLPKMTISAAFQAIVGSLGYTREDPSSTNGSLLQMLWNKLERTMVHCNSWLRETSKRVMSSKPAMQPRVTDISPSLNSFEQEGIKEECIFKYSSHDPFPQDVEDTEICCTEQLVELPAHVDEVSIEIQNGEVMVFGSSNDPNTMETIQQARKVMLKPDSKTDNFGTGARVKVLNTLQFISSVNHEDASRRSFTVQDSSPDKRVIPELSNFAPLRPKAQWGSLEDLEISGMSLPTEEIGEGYLLPQSPVSVLHSLVSPPAADGSSVNYLRVTHYRNILHTNVFLGNQRADLRRAWYNHPGMTVAQKSLRMLASADSIASKVQVHDTRLLYEPVPLLCSVLFSNSTSSFVIDASLHQQAIVQAQANAANNVTSLEKPVSENNMLSKEEDSAKVAQSTGEELDITRVLEEVGLEEEESREFQQFHSKWFEQTKVLKKEIAGNTTNSNDKRTTILAECYAPLLQQFTDRAIMECRSPKTFLPQLASILSAPSSKTANMYTPPRVLASAAVQQLGIARYLTMMQHAREQLLLLPEQGQFQLSDRGSQFHRTDAQGRSVGQLVQEAVTMSEEERLARLQYVTHVGSGNVDLVKGGVPVMDGAEAADPLEVVTVGEALLRTPCIVHYGAANVTSSLPAVMTARHPLHVDTVTTNTDIVEPLLQAMQSKPLPLAMTPLDFALNPLEAEILLTQHGISNKGHFQGSLARIRTNHHVHYTSTAAALKNDFSHLLAVMTTKSILSPTPDIAPDERKEVVCGVLTQSTHHAAQKIRDTTTKVKHLAGNVEQE